MNMAAYHAPYILNMPQSSMAGMFTEDSYPYDTAYDGMYIQDTSSSVPVIWNAAGELASYSPEREYASMAGIYERMDSA